MILNDLEKVIWDNVIEKVTIELINSEHWDDQNTVKDIVKLAAAFADEIIRLRREREDSKSSGVFR